jgi:hypothetical protein
MTVIFAILAMAPKADIAVQAFVMFVTQII